MLEKPLKDISILLVEDNEMNVLLASAILQRTGANITEADNGIDAINLLKNKSFDVVLMDLHMPMMNGFETTRYIRENLSLDVPIIAITANVVNGEETKCLEAGMNAFISKPYTEKNLLEKIAYCFTNKQERKKHTSTLQHKEDAKLYDLSVLEDICKGNRGLINEMVTAFIKQVPITLEHIKAAYQTKNFGDIYAAAHNIKPNIDTLQILTLTDNIRQIESFANQQKNGAELQALIQMLELTLSKVVEQLKTKELA